MDEESDPMSQFFDDPESVDLYTVLNLDSHSASTDDIKKAYRRLALSFHPDKHHSKSDEELAEMSRKFQQVGFAYTILSDATRRARYDETGRTNESFLDGVAESEGGWEGYFEAIFEKVSRQRLDEDKKEYQGSEAEKADITAAYLASSGSLAHILSHIPHTTYSDEARIISIVQSLLSSSTVPAFPEWEKSTNDKKAKAKRVKEGKKEEKEAEERARELGVWDEFYGSGKVGERKKASGGKGKGKGKADDGEDGDGDESALQALILKRAEKRKADSNSFLDGLAAKYGGGANLNDEDEDGEEVPKQKKRGKKRAAPADEDEDAIEEEDDDDVKASPRKKSRTTTKAKAKPPPAKTKKAAGGAGSSGARKGRK